jgi:glucosamine--fructose-6-phosphate aminotransferase (isomerizing)
MCGITGYIGGRQAQAVLIDALKRLEYRGYDSAGIALFNKKDNKLEVWKTKGLISELEAILPPAGKVKSNMGISHTRWATHGAPSKENAHPHLDCTQTIALVHNGIIENYLTLKEQLLKEGHKFTSETDTEVVVHLVEKYYRPSESTAGAAKGICIEDAVRRALEDVKGSYALAVICAYESDKIVAARNESPLVLGLGKQENFIASDVPALLKHTTRMIYLEDGELAVVRRNDIKITDLAGTEIKREWHEVEWTLEDAEKGGYEHFMLKEIFEQPKAIHESLVGRLSEPYLEHELADEYEFNHIKLIACGTSYHAALVGKYIFESLINIPTTVEMASEYRYSAPTPEKPLVIAITQSGETADTLAALRLARQRGCRTIAITNVVGSSVTREADDCIFTRAGPEIGVAATKTFTTQLVALYLLAIYFGRVRRLLEPKQIDDLLSALRRLPRYVQRVLNRKDSIERCARELAKSDNVFFIGRNINFPTALEGALKLKEISYIHAEGYPAGELKHGPLALLSPDVPVVAVAIQDPTYEKMLGNIGEVCARGAKLIAVANEGDREIEKYADTVLRVPKVPPILTPVVVTVALQLLSYYTARARKCPIDKPRNLAKSVTVE